MAAIPTPDARPSSPSETAAAINAGIAIAKPYEVTDVNNPQALVYIDSAGQSHVVDLVDALAGHQANPDRKTGTFRVHDGNSFVAYMAKHADPMSEVWADSLNQQIIGVLNSHTMEGAGWGDHRVTYKVELTEAWKAWKALDGRLVSQSEFAQLIEDRLVDIVTPAAADLLEIVQTFEATIGVQYQSSKLLSTGERQFMFKENIDAAGGRAGQFEIPKEFELALQPFEGADRQMVVARLRYKIENGDLRIGFKLNRPEDVLRLAFDSVVATVEIGVDCPVYKGVSA